MRRAVWVSVSLSCALGSGCAVPIKSTISPAQLLSAVHQAEAERDGTSPALPRALSAQQRELRLAALRALARTGEVGTSSLAITLLGDRDEEVARWAAFALGEIGEPNGEAALVASLRGVSPAPDAVLYALGRAGTATAARDVSALLTDGRPKVRSAAAVALGLLGKRLGKAVPPDVYAAKVAPLVKDAAPEVRWGAVYALMRLPSAASAVALIPSLGDADPEVRANAAKGLGLSRAAPSALDPALTDPDWRVRVEVVRALGALGKAQPTLAPAVATRLLGVVPRELARMRSGSVLDSGLATHVLLAIVASALDLGAEGTRVVQLLEKAPWEKTSEPFPAHAAPDLARLACAVDFALDTAEGVIRRVRSCGDASLPAWRREQLVARLLAAQGTDAAIAELVELSKHQDPRVRAEVVDALAEIEKEPAVAALSRLLDSNDPFVRSAAADALARPDRARLRPPGLVDRLGATLEELRKEPDPGFAISVLDALGALGPDATSALGQLEGLASDPRPAIRRRAARAREAITKKPVPYGRGAGTIAPRPAPAARDARLELTTTRGSIVLELDAHLAPATTGALVALAQSGFYDDRTFHRIVSDFVAQGGCPRGDGRGGPGYTLDEELSPAPFVRGALGIATSGRDTGGSQFFVMHAHHPHLDGNYALVGRVVEGMDVVDALQQDDRVLKATATFGPEDGRPAGAAVR